MRACLRLRHLLPPGARTAQRAARALGTAGSRLAERLAYRPREVVVVALLAGGLFGGLAVERWRARHPATAARLEAEPARLALPATSPPRARPRVPAGRCEEAGTRTAWARRQARDPAPASPRLDLNRATPGELARLAGISWGLAARLVAARDAFEGRAPAAAAEPPWRDRSTRPWRRPSPRLTPEVSGDPPEAPASGSPEATSDAEER
jgi:hypothetical protein